MDPDSTHTPGPHPQPPTVSRRAFLRAAVLGPLLGGAVGFAAGYALGRPAGDGEAPRPEVPTDRADEDARLTWALRLLEADDDTLLAQATGFVSVANRHADDPRVREGIARLTRVVLERSDEARARSAARLLVDLLDRIDPDSTLVDASLRGRLGRLAR